MKNVLINGKHNIYKCMKANMDENTDKIMIRDGMEHVPLEVINHTLQFEMIRILYMDFENSTFEHKQLLQKELERKINGYKGQDKNKEIYDKNKLITLEEVIEKIVSSKMKCYYCSCNVFLIYKNIREPDQWTLDRKDNDMCHSSDNTVIACLKCNLKRRVTDMNKFEFTKKLKIKKM
jgi:hypothetical protein